MKEDISIMYMEGDSLGHSPSCTWRIVMIEVHFSSILGTQLTSILISLSLVIIALALGEYDKICSVYQTCVIEN